VRWTAATVCSIAGVAAVRIAAAQPAPAEQPAPAPAIDPRSDAAWQLYHEAFAALMQGDPSRARALASTLVRDYPDHAATRLIRGAHLGLAPGAPPGAIDERSEPRSDHAGVEAPSRGARAELALFQSLHGLALGIEICVAADCNSGQAYLGLALLGTAAGTIGSLAAPDLTSGQRALLNSGTAWGAVNAGLLLIATNHDNDSQDIAAGLIAGQGLGLVAGGALFLLHPTAGQVGLANSGGVWAGVLTELTSEAIGSHLDQHARAEIALAVIDGGIAAGGYLASRWPVVSRAQTLVIDAGGIAGTLGGGALGVVISGSESGRTTPALAAAGAVIGLAAAAYFTRDWSDGSAAGAGAAHAYLVPPERGRGGVAGVAAAW
jgi:hypothetical protein